MATVTRRLFVLKWGKHRNVIFGEYFSQKFVINWTGVYCDKMIRYDEEISCPSLHGHIVEYEDGGDRLATNAISPEFIFIDVGYLCLSTRGQLEAITNLIGVCGIRATYTLASYYADFDSALVDPTHSPGESGRIIHERKIYHVNPRDRFAGNIIVLNIHAEDFCRKK